MRTVRQLVIVLSFAFTATFGAAMAAEDSLPVEIIPSDGEYASIPMATWDVWAFQQFLSFPEDSNPSILLTPESCTVGQFGPVFFLPAPLNLNGEEDMELHCVVAQGVAIYVPFHASSCSTVEAPPWFGETEEELAACAQAMEAGLEDSVISINGVSLDDPMQYHRTTPISTFQLGENNIAGMDPIVGKMVIDGHSFIIAPPAPGQYVIDLDNIRVGHPPMGHMRWIIDVVEPTVVKP